MLLDLNLLSSAIPQQVAIIGPDGRIQYGNAAFSQAFGLSEETFLGKPMAEVLPPALTQSIEKVLKGEAVEEEENSSTAKFLPTPEGGCIVVGDYPPEPNRHTYRIPDAAQRLQAFVDFAPIGMVFSHLDGRVLDANQAFLNIIGYTQEELSRGDVLWDKITPPEHLHLDYQAIDEAKVSGVSRSYEKEYFHKSGKRVRVLVGFILAGPNRDEAVAFVADLTAQQEAENEILRLNAELEERVATRTAELELTNRELEAFCYSVSHDLRAPLRSIDGFAFALYEDYGQKLDDDGVDFVNRIRASAKRMDELISALLTLSRITRTELELEDVDLTALATTASKELLQHHPEHRVEFHIQAGLTVRGDKLMLRSAIDNLFGNALKFTGKNPRPQITFGQDKTGAFFVEDNGVGFDMQNSSKLFQPFERLHSPREFTGSGIGLATVQRIVRKHGGKIWAQSEEHKGATFYFTLLP